MAPRKYVTLDQKIEIIELIENGQNYGMIAEKYRRSSTSTYYYKHFFICNSLV